MKQSLNKIETYSINVNILKCMIPFLKNYHNENEKICYVLGKKNVCAMFN